MSAGPCPKLHRLFIRKRRGRLLTKKIQCLPEGGAGLRRVERLRQRLLAEFLPGEIRRDRQVGIARCGQVQPLLQVNLARRGIQQIGAAHNVRDALIRIVNDYRQLISKKTVGAFQYEIADILGEILSHGSLYRIFEYDFSRIDPNPPGARYAAYR